LVDHRRSKNSREPQLTELLKPILYADLFDFPLTFTEICRFMEVKASPERVETLLALALERQQLILVDGFYSLADRPHLARRRRERARLSQTLWKPASRYGRWFAGLPFVRMVSVTGSLAVDNARSPTEDIDYLIVTRAGRLWFCRAMIILLVKLCLRRGVHLCPNYLVTEDRLFFEDQNLYAAREMVQMVPLYGRRTYRRLQATNPWVVEYLPQGLTDDDTPRLDDALSPPQRWFKRAGEWLLAGRLGDWLERLLQSYQINKHTRQAKRRGTLDYVTFTADQCKGHYDGHNHKTMQAYRERLQRLDSSPNGRGPGRNGAGP
jgi:hypothetical protein